MAIHCAWKKAETEVAEFFVREEKPSDTVHQLVHHNANHTQKKKPWENSVP